MSRILLSCWIRSCIRLAFRGVAGLWAVRFTILLSSLRNVSTDSTTDLIHLTRSVLHLGRVRCRSRCVEIAFTSQSLSQPQMLIVLYQL
jgi:hypothetical protein